jgi:hypothetical protein
MGNTVELDFRRPRTFLQRWLDGFTLTDNDEYTRGLTIFGHQESVVSYEVNNLVNNQNKL